MPVTGLVLLPIQPGLMLILLILEVLLELLNVALMEPCHLLDPQVKGLDLFVLVLDLSLEHPLFIHDLLHVYVPGLEEAVVLDVSHGGFRGMALDLLLVQGQQIVELLMLPLVFNLQLGKPQLIVLPQIKLVLDFLCEFVSRFFEELPQVVGLPIMSSVAVAKVAPQGLEVCLIEL